jgi:hypothetical protein
MTNGSGADAFEDAAREVRTHCVEEMRFHHREEVFTRHRDFKSEVEITVERAAPHLVAASPGRHRASASRPRSSV